MSKKCSISVGHISHNTGISAESFSKLEYFFGMLKSEMYYLKSLLPTISLAKQ
ncbi:hypothetical protein [uncultured Clostridium sp.]|uniref:hypothetical protein n=1 Tax=uncultured Clostridium sp. TaxID=59620 RepID=UPI0025EA2616|nr:hypothetical protein [uncultured Clostridium sp.]